MQQIHQLHGAAATMLQWRDGTVKMLQQPALAAAKLHMVWWQCNSCKPSGGGCLALATMGGCYEMLAAALPCGCSKVSVVDCNIVVAILLNIHLKIPSSSSLLFLPAKQHEVKRPHQGVLAKGLLMSKLGRLCVEKIVANKVYGDFSLEEPGG
ncbi:unnamed protein product [Prunus armeniaca]